MQKTNESILSVFREGLSTSDLFRMMLINLLDTAQIVDVISVEQDERGYIVSVRPLYENIDVEGNAIPTLETIQAKVIFPYGISFPIEVGSKGVLIALQVDNTSWDTDIIPSRLKTTRRYSYSNSVFIPMTVSSIPDNFVLTYKGNSITISEDKIDMTAVATVNVNAPAINLGGEDGAFVARLGDEVSVGGVTGTITSASGVVKAK